MVIPHYYGDTIRWIFVAAAVLMLGTLPFYPELLPMGTLFQIAWAVLLIVLAALTNPHNFIAMVANAALALVGVVLWEIAAVAAYQAEDPVLFVVREALAVGFLFALYLSLKTIRAMSMHQVGKWADKPGEFE